VRIADGVYYLKRGIQEGISRKIEADLTALSRKITSIHTLYQIAVPGDLQLIL